MHRHELSLCWWLLVVLPALLLSSANLRAQEPITAVPNRPTVSNPADTTQRGVLEAEYGTELAVTHQDINGLLKFGLFKDLELRFANVPVVADSSATTTGFGDIGLGLKYRFLHQKGRIPALSVGYSAKLPTAQGDLGSGEVDHTAIFLASKDLGKEHFDFNTSMNYLGRSARSGFDTDWTNAFAWSHPLGPRWTLESEIAGVTRQNASVRSQMQALLGAAFTYKPRCVFDFGVVGRIFGDIPDATFVGGVTYSIADLYRLGFRSVRKHNNR